MLVEIDWEFLAPSQFSLDSWLHTIQWSSRLKLLCFWMERVLVSSDYSKEGEWTQTPSLAVLWSVVCVSLVQQVTMYSPVLKISSQPLGGLYELCVSFCWCHQHFSCIWSQYNVQNQCQISNSEKSASTFKYRKYTATVTAVSIESTKK